MKLLHVDSSILGAFSASRLLSAETIRQWHAEHPHTEVEYLDLLIDTPPHFSADAMAIRAGMQSNPTPSQLHENALSERYVSQFLACDVIVVGAPMYNLTISSQLKAWIDRLAQAGRTFKYTEEGLVGLAGDKTVIVISTRGGLYSSSEMGQAMEHQESYLKAIFGFFGITDVRMLRAEGLALGEAARKQALETAELQIRATIAGHESVRDRVLA